MSRYLSVFGSLLNTSGSMFLSMRLEDTSSTSRLGILCTRSSGSVLRPLRLTLTSRRPPRTEDRAERSSSVRELEERSSVRRLLSA